MKDIGQEKVTVRVDGYTRVCLTAIVVLLTALVIGLWAEIPAAIDARAAEPFLNSSAQREETIKAVEATNERLDKIITLLKSGEVKVQMVGSAPDPGAAKKGAKDEEVPATKKK